MSGRGLEGVLVGLWRGLGWVLLRKPGVGEKEEGETWKKKQLVVLEVNRKARIGEGDRRGR